MQLHAYAADDGDAFAKIDLCVARRMGERDEDLARSGAGDPHVIFHHRVAAGIAMLHPQPFENPLRRMPLLGRCRHVGFQDRIDYRNQRSEFRPFRWLGPHIARWRGISAHLGDRIPAQSKDPRRFAPALPFDKYKPSNCCVRLHCKHPRPPLRIKVRKGSAQKWPGFTPPRATASCRRSMAYYCSAAYRVRYRISQKRSRSRRLSLPQSSRPLPLTAMCYDVVRSQQLAESPLGIAALIESIGVVVCSTSKRGHAASVLRSPLSAISRHSSHESAQKN